MSPGILAILAIDCFVVIAAAQLASEREGRASPTSSKLRIHSFASQGFGTRRCSTGAYA